jgi:hypothetical protein
LLANFNRACPVALTKVFEGAGRGGPKCRERRQPDIHQFLELTVQKCDYREDVMKWTRKRFQGFVSI